MVQIATFALAFTAALSSFVSAGPLENRETAIKGCTNGGIYCGFALKQKSADYNYRINDALNAAGTSTDIKHTDQSIFICGGDNYITFDQFCPNGCVGGTKDDDYCSDTDAKRGMKFGERSEE
ncbi:hypothetical protein BKA67DRAFT_656775 [Truncatella angustata]|uniref:Uncharacterized protein n=1 Tax=Truncatella angustata TaxID=152316 RepID=A0A9P8UUT5_9PEZI|nr:uncharacterized protein BKA67DRAFT_539762 [Truncatella angustata]XP_045962833.1 uncharacterized protein BKA67DRAFT_656775 [Truncatella angustata]KAH6647932.1 hypothetical protein BKA67DRAFT_539762 [Truncatella angustata]KAH6658599.1 hypothetical protein BKA67DRAFT_656775 [Truncatella angustata]KAH8195694.1 hypothetical protein TruAng_010152 [Truncatella angustata]